MRAMSRSTREIEIKLPFPTAEEAVLRLTAIGASPASRRVFEDNRVLDDEGGSLARAGRLLRVRTAGNRSLLTVKSPVESNTRHKVREEIETAVADAEASIRLLERLGFRTVWRYQKYRTTFALPGLEATVDETPIGCYVELEGDPQAIDRAAADLGFSPDRYVTATYRDLAEEHAAKSGRDVEGILVFAPTGEGDRP
jgi:adenylate cyclase class 2